MTETLSAGIIPVKKVRGSSAGANPSVEFRFLLLRAFKYWDFPKGRVEAGEDPIHGAIRELREETGLRNPQFHWGKEFKETPIYGHGKTARYYLAEVSDEEVVLGINPEINRAEHHEYRWCTGEESRLLISPRVQPIFNWALTQLRSKPIA